MTAPKHFQLRAESLLQGTRVLSEEAGSWKSAHAYQLAADAWEEDA